MRVEVKGIRQFRRELKKVDAEFPKELRRLLKEAAELVASRARPAAPRRVAGAIKSRSTQTAAKIAIVPRPPYALTVFLGAKRRTGWYAARRYQRSRGRQFRPWVGNQWTPGERAGEPYHIGRAINSSVDDVIDLIGDGIDDLVGRAFRE